MVKLLDNAPPPVNGAVVLTVRLVLTCDDVALSTYNFVAACAFAVGVAMVIGFVTTKVPLMVSVPVRFSLLLTDVLTDDVALSTYNFVAACVFAVGVATVIGFVTTKVPLMVSVPARFILLLCAVQSVEEIYPLVLVFA